MPTGNVPTKSLIHHNNTQHSYRHLPNVQTSKVEHFATGVGQRASTDALISPTTCTYLHSVSSGYPQGKFICIVPDSFQNLYRNNTDNSRLVSSITISEIFFYPVLQIGGTIGMSVESLNSRVGHFAATVGNFDQVSSQLLQSKTWVGSSEELELRV